MKAKVNGIDVEGTPEEIGKMLGFTVVDLRTHQDYIPCPPGYNPGFCCYDEDCNACREQWVKESWNLKGEKI